MNKDEKRDYMRVWYNDPAHPERREKKHAYYRARRKKILAKRRVRYYEHRDEILAKRTAKFAQNPALREKARLATRAWNEEDPQRARESRQRWYRKWRLEHPIQEKRMPSGSGHCMWKGDQASYTAIHNWIRKQLGAPKACKQCGKTGYLHWANIDHQYRRVVEDYVALCPSCHEKQDIAHKLPHRAKELRKSRTAVVSR